MGPCIVARDRDPANGTAGHANCICSAGAAQCPSVASPAGATPAPRAPRAAPPDHGCPGALAPCQHLSPK
eukprot:7503882-Pyramimonas_sp.AAC.1